MRPIDAALRLAHDQYGVIRTRQARELGVSCSVIDRLVRQGHWKRVHHGVSIIKARLPPEAGTPAGLPRLLLPRLTAALLAVGPTAVIAGTSAARLWGLQGLPRWRWDDPVHVIVPPRHASRTTRGVVQHTWETAPDETTIHHGLEVTTPGRTLRDTVLQADRPCAVSLIDSALNQGLVEVVDLERLAAANRSRRGSRRTRSWWRQADSRAQSTFETRVRLVCTDGGLPPDELQHSFFTPDGVFAGRVDMYWRARRLAVECDGREPHGRPEVLADDRRRQNRLTLVRPRIQLIRLTWDDLRYPDYILDCVRSAPVLRDDHGK
ncbi:putative transcriptional regulator of viral defense system [Nocardiopsis mwathae]|uniref:Putative transcriptional regulator of viral defense system n=1 Tax=Nocardiopsis mwathae TaxID=1472723 RepID=A0A7X0D7I1_9ACTN|nr:type IV toxin-antitoxin system AbiEi family antitoxin domain-containing protein [Nocardiopsis mwathae]MBB6174662.1 putative transcriptional regulator of viral defense system [Nocardiopsis mwathae]